MTPLPNRPATRCSRRAIARMASGLVALGMLLAHGPASAAGCGEAEVARAVEGAGEQLRRFNAQNTPRLQAKLKELKARNGWSDTEYENRSGELLHDARIEDFDRQAGEILARIDALGVTTGAQADCAKIGDLEAASAELLATMKAKASYTLSRLDQQLAGTAGPPAIEALARKSAAAPPAKSAPQGEKARQPKAVAPPATTGQDAWGTTTRAAPGGPAIASTNVPTASEPRSPLAPSPEGLGAGDPGYTIDEIREASRGFFGALSTELGSVIEYAFRKSGRPTAYILGTEGGGAFLAGLRYGEGTLYLRSGGNQRIFWHGPSLGSDIGASGSRTMFLIYRAGDPASLYRRFSGIDGSAYFVGGVGVTFLTDGRVMMAPIRSGVGLRLGASIGYIRFSPTPTWNPF